VVSTSRWINTTIFFFSVELKQSDAPRMNKVYRGLGFVVKEESANYFHSQNLFETFPDSSTSCSNTATKGHYRGVL
jgi:hypothetical protein